MATTSCTDQTTTSAARPSSVNGACFVSQLEAISGRATDGLLIPTKFLHLSKVQSILNEAAKEGKKNVTTPAIAEEFLLALLASNQGNDLWVSQT